MEKVGIAVTFACRIVASKNTRQRQAQPRVTARRTSHDTGLAFFFWPPLPTADVHAFQGPLYGGIRLLLLIGFQPTYGCIFSSNILAALLE
jgi:hypothetical protein